ncbi:MAG: hypothetical protein P0Y49_22435 [Candidatus Pedobacter colombiensis]|uniref:Uncharacterized protein n=1 Tax=Candidatus Pedobacter colombiensis TaxID=3121371 RepID=A0AAJ6B8V3_9SPHI|nr:hypothetical protein [Pedobacter sp.]WEK19533.1 MAG: hypothetical protein P0Y49_22435 [Pedobacter sp.]
MKTNFKILSLLVILTASAFMFGFKPDVHTKLKTEVSKTLVDESITVYSSAITGANDVQIRFYRTGPEAGQGEVTITYSVRFNDGNPQTFTKVMANGETESIDHVQGPNPTGWAEVTDYSWTY